jgi:hypothetical protein
MSVCYVKAGQCKNEVVIRVHQKGPSLASIEVETTCEHIKKLAEELKNIKVGEEMTLPICETQVYKTASKYLCRTSCVVPSAILKAIEVQFKIFEPVNASIEFIEL